MKVAVIGARGFIGRAIISRLVQEGVAVNALSRDWQGVDTTHWGNCVTILDGDAAKPEVARMAMRGCSVAYFLAYEGVPLSEEGDHVHEYVQNIRMLGTAFASAEYGGVERFVFLSSGGTVYGEKGEGPIKEDSILNPISHYGNIKKLSEEMLSGYARVAGTFKFVIARVGNPFGPGQIHAKRKGLVVSAMLKVKAGEPVPMFNDGSQVRDYIYIEDAVSALIEVGRNVEALNQRVNVGSGVGRSIAEVLNDIERITGREVQRLNTRGRSQDVQKNVLCVDKLHRITGWRSQLSYEDALRKTWQEVQGTPVEPC